MPKIPPPFYAYPWKSAPPNFNFIQTMKPTRYPVEELLKFAPKELETSVARLGQSRARVIAEHAAAQEAPSTTLEDELKPKSPPTPKKVAFAETAELIGEKGGSTKLEKPEGKTDEKTIGESTEIAIQKMGKKDEEWDYRKDPLWNPGGGNIPPPKDQPKAEAADGEEGTKKKKKKRSKVNADGTPKVKKPAPTGFEEYYADAPITPFEFKEERDVIYNHERLFGERIEACITRYKAKRKLNSERGNYLLKYLTLGAVDTTIKQFQGEGKGVKRRPEKPIDDESDMEDYDGPKIHNVIGAKVTSYEPIFDTSQKAVSKYYNPNAPQNWEVDWVGVASCFLSIRAPYLWGIWRPEVVDGYCEVVINFLNYVMMHGVCPEYTNDILAARRVAQKAKFELKDIEQIYKRVPGQFHYAMQVLADTNEWGLNTLPDEEDDLYLAGDEQVLANVADEGYRSKHLTLAQAEAAVRTTIGLLGTPEQRLVLNSWTPGTKFVATKSYNQGFEVLEIIRLNEDQLHAFSMAAYHGGKIEGLIDPHGILVLRPWTNPNDDMLVSVLDEYPHERKARERAERKAAREKAVAIANGTYVGPTSLLPTQRMFMDFAILKHFHVGMKIEARIAHAVLADGSSEIEIVFAERLMAVQASFFCPINNERMEYWKDPVETERDPPKSTDPEPGQEDDAGDCEVDD